MKMSARANRMNFFEMVPKYFFEKQMGQKPIKQVIFYFSEYYLKGIKTIVTDSGAKNDLRFDEIAERDKFQAPFPYFVLYRNNEIKLDELVFLLYFSYLVHNQKSNKVKFNPSLAVKRTGLSKTKIKGAIQNLMNHPLEFIKDGGKPNRFIVTYHDQNDDENIEIPT